MEWTQTDTNFMIGIVSLIIFIVAREYESYKLRNSFLNVTKNNKHLRSIERVQNINSLHKVIDERMEIIFRDRIKNDLITLIALQKNKLSVEELDEQIIELSKTIFSSINGEDKKTLIKCFNMSGEEELLKTIIIKSKNYISNIVISSKVKVI